MAEIAGCIELVENGSFDPHGDGWSQVGSSILPTYVALNEIPMAHLVATLDRQDGYAIRLGVTDAITVSGLSATQQVIQLPKSSDRITLRFRYLPLYAESLSVGDLQYVDIYHGESGLLLARALDVQSNERMWTQYEFDLSRYAGELIRLFFLVSNDAVGGNIAMYIDDVSVLACEGSQLQPQNSLAMANDGALTPHSLSAERLAVNPAAASTTNPILAEELVKQEVTPLGGFSFGRMAGLLVALGIAGTALVLLPFTKRYIK